MCRRAVRDWLVLLTMEEYMPMFVKRGYNSLEKCKQIVIGDLLMMGIDNGSHRKLIIDGVQLLYNSPQNFECKEPCELHLPFEPPDTSSGSEVDCTEDEDLKTISKSLMPHTLISMIYKQNDTTSHRIVSIEQELRQCQLKQPQKPESSLSTELNSNPRAQTPTNPQISSTLLQQLLGTQVPHETDDLFNVTSSKIKSIVDSDLADSATLSSSSSSSTPTPSLAKPYTPEMWSPVVDQPVSTLGFRDHQLAPSMGSQPSDFLLTGKLIRKDDIENEKRENRDGDSPD